MKNNKGLVLVALIIIIIVMVILFKVTFQTAEDTAIIENAEYANYTTEYNTILEYFVAAQSLDENLESNILETVQNFVTNNELSDVKYTVYPNPFEKEYLYDNPEEQIVIVKGQQGYYKFQITKKEVNYLGQTDQSEAAIYDY